MKKLYVLCDQLLNLTKLFFYHYLILNSTFKVGVHWQIVYWHIILTLTFSFSKLDMN